MSDIVRVLRILEYVGRREWVEMALKNGGVPANGERCFDSNITIRSAVVGDYPEILENNNGEKSNPSGS